MISELGSMAADGFSVHMDIAGAPIVIYKNYGWPQQDSHTAKAFKGEEKGHSVFVFYKNENVQKGDVLQIKGSRDLWRVIDIEDNVIGGEVISLLAFIEKEGGASRRQASPATITINAHNSPNANFNLGSGNINQQVSWVDLTNQKIDSAVATSEEKQKAKSLLTQISENKLLNTIIGSAVGELTKAVLPK